ncbi:hypothetical protein PIIN_07199 [Serendipita indica DSM 11827]|uniref:DUF6533 domain-containing protein n=1 Tax=Serendipita indica (strain DSM 11827) TaxID=1109443 RepID=G4TPK1_SERID|nr:hypothetical protein PIIN_07199 [Serendipita indica DSM 11827]
MATNGTMAFNSTLAEYGNTTSTTGNGTSTVGTDSPSPAALAMVAFFSVHVQSKQASLGLAAWVIYDYFLTIEDSVTLFWSYRWSISKVLFFLSPSRQIHPIRCKPKPAFLRAQLTINSCHIYPWLWLTGATSLICIMNLVLVSRIYALWNRSQLILIIMMFGLVVNVGYYFGIVAYTHATSELQHTSLPFTGCSSVSHFTKGWTLLVVSLVFEVVLIVLTAIKTYPIVIQRGFNAPLYTLLLRDGFLYFIIIMVMQIISLYAIFYPAPLTTVLLISFPTLSIMGIFCSRLLLRLQRALTWAGDEPYSEYARTDLTKDWPIVTFGGSGGGKHSRERMTDHNRTSTNPSVPTLFRTNHGFSGSRERRKYDDSTTEHGEELMERGSDLVVLEPELKYSG